MLSLASLWQLQGEAQAADSDRWPEIIHFLPQCWNESIFQTTFALLLFIFGQREQFSRRLPLPTTAILQVTCHSRRSATHSEFHHSSHKQANTISSPQPSLGQRTPSASFLAGIDSISSCPSPQPIKGFLFWPLRGRAWTQLLQTLLLGRNYLITIALHGWAQPPWPGCCPPLPMP